MIYIIATFVLQVTFLNMLIAIMGNVFDAVHEKQHQSSIKERIVLLNDFRSFLSKFELNIGDPYLFVVSPSIMNQLEDSLESKVQQVQESTEDQSKKILTTQEHHF